MREHRSGLTALSFVGGGNGDGADEDMAANVFPLSFKRGGKHFSAGMIVCTHFPYSVYSVAVLT